MHDLLHTLEFQCYGTIVREARRFPRDQTGLDMLNDSLLTLEQIVYDANKLTIQHNLYISDILWIKELENAKGALQDAISKLEIKSLNFSINIINQTLANIPYQINTKINRVAASLRVSSLIAKSTSILKNLTNSNLDFEKIIYFQNSVTKLNDLYSNVSYLIQKHDEWQLIDFKMRQIEIIIEEKDFSAFKSYWLNLKAISDLQFNSCEEDWAIDLRKDYENLESLILAEDKVRVKSIFRIYRRRVSLRFYKVDKDLKQVCSNLRTICEPLSIILGMIV